MFTKELYQVARVYGIHYVRVIPQDRGGRESVISAERTIPVAKAETFVGSLCVFHLRCALTFLRPQVYTVIRMRYQNKNMILPICAEEGKHLPGSPEFCTFAAFRDRVRELTPTDWDSECAPAGRSL